MERVGMAKRKKRKVVKLLCKYCKYLKNKRYCSVKRQSMLPNSKICKRFRIVDTSWCIRKEWQIAVDVCLNNIKKRKHGCMSCHQGKTITKLMEVQDGKSKN